MVRTSQQLSGAAGKPPYVRQSHAAEYARGEVHEHRAECLFPLLKPYLWVFRGISKLHLPGYLGFFQCLPNIRLQKAVEPAFVALARSSSWRACGRPARLRLPRGCSRAWWWYPVVQGGRQGGRAQSVEKAVVEEAG